MSEAQEKVLIIGAGPVGGAFAQVLRKQGIAFEVFDREPEMNARTGGTFILDDCLTPLLAALPSDMTDVSCTSANYNIGEQDTMAYINGIKSAWGRKQGYVPRGQDGYSITAHRGHFREWIGQKLPIQYSKRLDSYEEDAEGVTAYFTDGTSARGTILVGVDGASSVVRRQLLNNPSYDINRHIPICGTVDLPRYAYEDLKKFANSMVVANSPTCHVMVSQMDISADRSTARYWWLCSFVSEDPAADAAWVSHASREDLFVRALESCQELPEVIVEVIRRTGPSGLWDPQIKFSEFIPPENMPRGRVTLMGDAAHNAAPFGGRGVNCGLRDAVDLGTLLGQNKPKTADQVADVLKKYEAIMAPRGKWVVEDARDKAECKPLMMPPSQMVLPLGFELVSPPVMMDRADQEKTRRVLDALLMSEKKVEADVIMPPRNNSISIAV